MSNSSSDLVNTAASASIPTLDSNIAKASFPINRWGYSLDDNMYKPIITNLNTTLKATNTSIFSDTTTLNLAAKVNLEKPVGTYSNTFIFTAIPNYYAVTINWNANEGTVNPTSSDIEYGTALGTLPVPTRDGYNFLGWFTELEDGEEVTAETMAQSNVTYYAHWELASLCGTTPTMQNIANLKGSLFTTQGAQVKLCDERDGKTYWAAKLPDGNIWMTQNLDLELDSSVALTNELTDLNSKTSWTPNRNTQDHQYKTASGTIDTDGKWDGNCNTVNHSYRPASDVAAGTSGKFGTDTGTYFSPVFMKNGTTMASYKTEAECVANSNTQSDCQHWNVGTFYSWRAATAGSGDGSVSTVTNVPDSICPKGWRLPKSGSSDNDFQALVHNGMTKTNITSAPYYFLRSGRYLGGYGAVYNTGDGGFYWSSTSYSNTSYAYYLNFSSSSINPSSGNDRYYGMSVRCVATGS